MYKSKRNLFECMSFRRYFLLDMGFWDGFLGQGGLGALKISWVFLVGFSCTSSTCFFICFCSLGILLFAFVCVLFLEVLLTFILLLLSFAGIYYHRKSLPYLHLLSMNPQILKISIFSFLLFLTNIRP